MRLNKAVMLNVGRGLLDAPFRLLLAGLGLLVFYGVAAQVGGLQGALTSSPEAQTRLLQGLVTLGNGILRPLVWVLGFGLVSREAARGSLPLVLLRPLSRGEYALSKWAALTAAAAGLVLIVHAIFLAHGWLSVLGLGPWALLLLAQLVQVAAVAAVLTLLSCVPGGVGELGLLVLGYVILFLLQSRSSGLGLPWLDQALEEGYQVLLPKIPSGGLLSLLPQSGQLPQVDLAGSLLHNALIAVLALAGAVALLKRREFSYSGD